MKAEVNRSMRRFDRARDIIESITDPKFEWIKEKFIAEINQANNRVFRLKREQITNYDYLSQ